MTGKVSPVAGSPVADRCAMPTGTPEGCPLPGDHDGACQPEPVHPPCKCSHIAATHGTDRNGRAVCWSAACGCIAYRPKDAT